ncbi:hypothetical protein [Phenylobacterium sp.]|uniref:hypothetical protein n=1 Tax=Phenylobacterium sp. TaxID=1871053 RepID=UPI00286E4E8D|nr:hypothetical protein [Phenylobacterium sp.]
MTSQTGRRTPGNMDKSGKPKSAEREAQLAQALRANLRRRKAPEPRPAPAKAEDDK